MVEPKKEKFNLRSKQREGRMERIKKEGLEALTCFHNINWGNSVLKIEGDYL